MPPAADPASSLPSYWQPHGPPAVPGPPPPAAVFQQPADPWFPAYEPMVAYGQPPTESMATSALVTGIASLGVNLVGWVFGWLFLGPVFWLVGVAGGIAGIVIARVARRRISQSGGRRGGESLITGGLVTSIIAVILGGAGLIFTLIAVAALGMLFATGG